MSALLHYPQRSDARLELIEGEIVEMAPIGSRHAGAFHALNRLFEVSVALPALLPK